MKTVISTLRAGRSGERVAPNSDDSLGRGMDLALTLLAFVLIGALIDSWLGIFPVVTIVLVVFAAVGSFIRMKYVYDATMERHEAARRGAGRRPVGSAEAMEDAA